MKSPDNQRERSSDSADIPARPYKRRALLFTMLSAMWVFPSAGACFILAMNRAPWQASLTFAQRLQVVNFEQWCAIALLTAHLLFIILAIHFRRTESPQPPPPPKF